MALLLSCFDWTSSRVTEAAIPPASSPTVATAALWARAVMTAVTGVHGEFRLVYELEEVPSPHPHSEEFLASLTNEI